MDAQGNATAFAQSFESTASQWPSPLTTGVPAGTILTIVNANADGEIFTSANNQTLDAKDFRGVLRIRHNGVKVRRSRAKAIIADEGRLITGLVIEDCTIVGGAHNSGVVLVMTPLAVVRRCNVGNVENGIWLEADTCLIEGNYLHDVLWQDPLHGDGIQTPGISPKVKNCIIRGNNLDLAPEVSSAITSASIENFTIDANRIHGGFSANITFDGVSTGCHVTNNLFDASGSPIGGASAATQIYSGNYRADGTPLPLP